MRFDELNLIDPILKAVQEEGYEIPTPIQEQAIPLLLERRDLVGCAQTGTGKTAAFAIPILQLLTANKHATTHKKSIRTLILTPTRELALQIADSFNAYGRHLPLKTAVIFGGVSQVAQTNTLKAGVDILVATPGRLLDLIGQKYIELHHVEIFVLDEADRMLDMGFAPDVKRIIGMLPEIRQNMLFSATMPPEITKLVDKLLNEPAKVAVTPVSSTVEIIDQTIYFVGKKEKILLLTHLLENTEMKSVLVFTRTKHGADRVQKALTRSNISVAAIHGDKSQNNRVAALTQFKTRQLRVLVATDIAARGIDVDELSHVVNYDLPNVPETYVHRIGRTGRAGFGGTAISFCDEEEKAYLKDIQKLIGKQVPIVHEQPFPLDAYIEPEPAEMPEGMNRGRGRNGQRAPVSANRPVSSGNRSGRTGTSGERCGNRSENASRSTSHSISGAFSSQAALPQNTKRSENDRRSTPDPDAFERMSRLLDGGRGRQPGGDRSGRQPGGDRSGRQPGGDRSGRQPGGDRSGQSRNNADRSGQSTPTRSQSAPTRSQSAPTRSQSTPTRSQSASTRSQSTPTRSQSTPTRSQTPSTSRSDTQDRSNRTSDRGPATESHYQGRASEQPGPYEKSSFLSKPLKSRPRGV